MSKYHQVRIKEIADLSKDHKIWKIQWIGQTSINTSTGEMVIDVCLVPFHNREDFTETDKNAESLILNSNYIFKESRIISIGVGQLPLIRVGAVYKEGYPYAYPKFITEKFSFTVSENNQEIISSNGFWGKETTSEEEPPPYYLPASQYQVFVSGQDYDDSLRPFAAKSLVLNFPENESPSISLDRYPLNLPKWREERNTNQPESENSARVNGLIVPCIEMVRFYYTKSSQLCREILFGGLDRNRIYVQDKTFPPTSDENGYVMLSRFVRNRDIQIIARLALDDYARSQARNIYTSSLNNIRNEGAALPEAKFPFKDQSTELTVHGTYLQSKERIYFLVFWIESCTAEFTFGNVEYWRTNPRKAKAPETKRDIFQSASVSIADENGQKVLSNSGKTGDEDEIRHTKSADTLEVQSENTPSEFREKINVLLEEDKRFPALCDDQFLKRKPRVGDETERYENEIRPNFINDGKQDVEIAGTSPRGGSRHITQTAFTSDDMAEDPDELEDIAERHVHDEKTDPPEMKEFFRKEKSGEPKKSFDDIFPRPIRGARKEALPIDLDVFRGILGWILSFESRWKIRMLNIPSRGPAVQTKNASRFPNHWFSSKRPAFLPDELFVAEIEGPNKMFAYLMDIEAKDSPSGDSSRSFRMLICFEMHTFAEIPVDNLRRVIRDCEANEGKWKINGQAFKDERKLPPQHLDGILLKHTRSTEKKYAEDIIKEIRKY